MAVQGLEEVVRAWSGVGLRLAVQVLEEVVWALSGVGLRLAVQVLDGREVGWGRGWPCKCWRRWCGREVGWG